MTTTNTTYRSYRIELSKPYAENGKIAEFHAGWRRQKFDARTVDEQTVRTLANKAYAEGYNVTAYLLEKVDGEWKRTEIGEAKHAKNARKTSSTPVAASADFEKRLESVEKRLESVDGKLDAILAVLAKKSK